MIATAPGKLILTGEYAVLEGAPALVVAVSRRVVATRRTAPRGSSPFLIAVADEIAAKYGTDHPATRAAMEIVVDSTAFYQGTAKLGLGSSAAVTVAATALALAADHESIPVIDKVEVLAIATAAHARAQGERGARGSGADIAAAVFGGVLAFQRTSPDQVAWPRDAARRGRSITIDGPYSIGGAERSSAGSLAGPVERPSATNLGATAASPPPMSGTADKLGWPAAVRILPFFTGMSADTATLVSQVAVARDRNRAAVDAALAAIDKASRAACQACAMRSPEIASNALIAALALAAEGIDQLASATSVPLVPSCVAAARLALRAHGGTAKTTGAGGGDIGIAVLPAREDATVARRLLIEAGCQPLALTVDQTGVDLQPDTQ
jgi:phosphomevalonate kinase